MNTLSIPSVNDSLLTWLNYLGQIHVTGIDLGLERVQPVAEYLKVTQPNAKVITVAGTNGKGSTTTTIASILTQQGYRVALYQSPHIYRFNERVKINGIEVADDILVQAFVQVEQARQACGLSLSFFEATTLASFLIFKQQNCNVWVLEVGLGGRLDVVNVIAPDVAVITNIGIDHVDWLGDNIEQIAYEKAGIIRANIPVVFAGEQVIPQAIIDKVEQCHASLYAVNRDYFIQQYADRWQLSTSGMTLSLPYASLAIQNVAAAVNAILLSGLAVSETALQQGIMQAKLSGRFEIRQVDGKTVIFDAGHNPHGIDFLRKQLQNYLQQNTQYREVVVVFSMLVDKDIQSVVNDLKTDIVHWYIAPLNVQRAASEQQLLTTLDGQNVTTLPSIQQAFELALSQLQTHQIMLVCGSFHTLEAIWEHLNHE
ncbi:bifunctional tetrahydrofolate synthase/dihydrofolate synthase [Moraxella sp. ZY210820]|uniref:bifunctional tetrahydrofolate synthase/dihydrofolate synthase n=1 Tax=unclassified Moraxella TaxID=2685852 RepID=UPI00272FBB16|nr:bifunctional tetrahydrofolate synthase/dihydrofolate synthase [Moraxella sp. ZY210820]WLF82962.1 bifunctional tetrahydrofolate synthase/dihydrofolate synthase [Moraxella sp. ZY210820]